MEGKGDGGYEMLRQGSQGKAEGGEFMAKEGELVAMAIASSMIVAMAERRLQQGRRR